jgi:hypothetical protein
MNNLTSFLIYPGILFKRFDCERSRYPSAANSLLRTTEATAHCLTSKYSCSKCKRIILATNALPEASNKGSAQQLYLRLVWVGFNKTSQEVKERLSQEIDPSAVDVRTVQENIAYVVELVLNVRTTAIMVEDTNDIDQDIRTDTRTRLIKINLS